LGKKKPAETKKPAGGAKKAPTETKKGTAKAGTDPKKKPTETKKPAGGAKKGVARDVAKGSEEEGKNDTEEETTTDGTTTEEESEDKSEKENGGKGSDTTAKGTGEKAGSKGSDSKGTGEKAGAKTPKAGSEELSREQIVKLFSEKASEADLGELRKWFKETSPAIEGLKKGK